MLHEAQHAKPSSYPSSYIYKSNMPKLVHIAPAPERKLLSISPDVQPKKYNYKSPPYAAQSVSIARRNARERNRVKQVNDGFNVLRKKLPADVIAALSGGSRRGSGKKLSKVDTLRMVVEYIRYMERILDESDSALGITRVNNSENMTMDTSFQLDIDEGVYPDGSSPYSEAAPSPVGSECSSGISSSYSSGAGYVFNGYQVNEEQTSAMGEDELLDAISWWQQK